MGSDLKELKYRRRIGVEERAQCSDPRGGADWAALQQDPVELLRKLDELRDQITRSCHVVGQPRDHRRFSRRAVSVLPEHLEPPPLPGYHRSRYGGRYGLGLPPPSPHTPLRPEHGERYVRQSSAHYRQYPGKQWENGGIGPGSYHHYGCACPHCLHGQRPVPQEENIPMARYFAGQHESYRFERSPSVSSDYDRRSVASSLYSHRSVSKRRAEFFRKKAEHICRPVDGAAPFAVCSSCYKLLQMPMEKCIGRKRNQFQCGSCCQIISLKLDEGKGIPLVPSSSLYVPEMEQSSTDQMMQDSTYQRHKDFNYAFYNSNEHSSMQFDMDFADDNSLSSTTSHGRTDKEYGSNRSIQSKAEGLSFSPRMSLEIGSPKDILCERDTGCEAEPLVHGPVTPRSPVLEDKLVDPLCTQEKGFEDLSLLNKSMDSAKVSINGHPISKRALKKAEKKAGPVDPGSYWYDYHAGFWGVMGRECIGIIPPFIKEFNYPMARNCAGGNTGVFVNGRELCQRDLDLLVGRGLPRTSGKSYSIEISGNITDEATGKKLRSLGKLAPTIEKLKRGFGMHVPEEFR
ncbi:hypothetical protein PVAP13_5KG460800 [Panicum virgatum]|uniref:Probable zinc-ribbon domain-containing protein n=1 Tax=Panicum virgatum TaxID=38727 RepID=A0A8T0SPX9_PANVG|nr:hypothetical protein PVAP13_5KG460800 [Panicum virgatum]